LPRVLRAGSRRRCLLALRALPRGRAAGRALLPTSLTRTSVAGGMALAPLAISGEVELGWWLPNAYLLLFPSRCWCTLRHQREVVPVTAAAITERWVVPSSSASSV